MKVVGKLAIPVTIATTGFTQMIGMLECGEPISPEAKAELLRQGLCMRKISESQGSSSATSTPSIGASGTIGGQTVPSLITAFGDLKWCKA
jgi:hypothetical protein